MYIECYIDQFFLEHVLTGCLLLCLAAAIQKQKTAWSRILLGSLANGAAATLGLICRFPLWYVPGFLLAVGIAFGRSGIRNYGKRLCSLAVLTVCFGGMAEALLGLLQLPLMAVSGLAAAGVYLIACIAAGRTMPDLLVPVRLLWDGKSAEVTALIDTGNHLTEPLTGRPVSIIAGEIAEKLMEERQIQQQGCFLIPYHSIGVEKGYLQGVTIDRMEIGKQGTITTINKPVLAIYKGKISAEGQYEMILHPLHAALENRK